MATTLSELRTQLRTELKKDPNWKIWTDTELNRYINNSIVKIQKDWNYNWRENQSNTTFSTVVWTQEYALPTNLWKIQLVRFNWNNLLKTEKIILKREQSTFVSWTPSKYYIYWAYIWFDVLPNSVWTVDFDYLKRLASLSLDSDESEFNSDFDILIIKYASFLAWSSLDWKQNTANSKLQEYQLELDTLVSTYIFNNVEDLTFWLQRGDRYITQATVLDR